MAFYYALSDIHGELDLFRETLKLVDLSGGNKLFLLGDYIDSRTQDFDILYFIKKLQEKYNDQVIVLAGNHELSLIEEIESKSVLLDGSLTTWLKKLPFYYETPSQVYVHAGIDEEAGELWKWGSEDYYFCSKYPHTTGKFYKDIIAGHIATSEISGEAGYHKVYWDKQSHFYIDGSVHLSKFIPILKYDTVSGRYTSFKKLKKNDGSTMWKEYTIK